MNLEEITPILFWDRTALNSATYLAIETSIVPGEERIPVFWRIRGQDLFF